MDRREFVAAVGAGALFPAEIVKALVKPKYVDMGWVGPFSMSTTRLCGCHFSEECPTPSLDGFPSGKYPIYYMRKGAPGEVYKIWQPNILLGVGETLPCGRHTVASYCPNGFLHSSYDSVPQRTRQYIGYEQQFPHTPVNGLIIDSGSFAVPYQICGGMAKVMQTTQVPGILELRLAKMLCNEGHLYRRPVWGTFEQYKDARWNEHLAAPSGSFRHERTPPRFLSRKNATPYCEEKTSC